MIGRLLDVAEEFWWLGIFSVATFILTILILPLVITALPPDYFTGKSPVGFRRRKRKNLFPFVLKNFAGIALLFMGIVMLFSPGQGLLTIFAGLSLMNFPGKRKLEIKLVSNRKVFKSLNWIRKKRKKDLFLFPGSL